MYSYYQGSTICYVYLEDVPSRFEEDPSADNSSFRDSKWFTRGWTLQELLAPRTVVFVAQDWIDIIGSKVSLSTVVSSITGIPTAVLLNDSSFCTTPDLFKLSTAPETIVGRYSIAQRMSWAARRETSRPEDLAYCLMGIFGVSMPPLYGEGGSRAFVRLQEEIIKYSNDQSIFAWKLEWNPYAQPSGLFAGSPCQFSDSGRITAFLDDKMNTPNNYSMTNLGVNIQLPLQRIDGSILHSIDNSGKEVFLAVLDCQEKGRNKPLAVFLRRLNCRQYVRVMPEWLVFGRSDIWHMKQDVCVPLLLPDSTPRVQPCGQRLGEQKVIFLKLRPQCILESYPKNLLIEQDTASGGTSISFQHWILRLRVSIPSRKLPTRMHNFIIGLKLLDEGIWCDIKLGSVTENLAQLYESGPPNKRNGCLWGRFTQNLSEHESVTITTQQTGQPGVYMMEIEVGDAEVNGQKTTFGDPSLFTYGFGISMKMINLNATLRCFPQSENVLWVLIPAYESSLAEERFQPLLSSMAVLDSDIDTLKATEEIQLYLNKGDAALLAVQRDNQDRTQLFVIVFGIDSDGDPWIDISNERSTDVLGSTGPGRLAKRQRKSGLYSGCWVDATIEEKKQLDITEVSHWIDITAVSTT